MSPNTFSFRLEGTVTCNICVGEFILAHLYIIMVFKNQLLY